MQRLHSVVPLSGLLSPQSDTGSLLSLYLCSDVGLERINMNVYKRRDISYNVGLLQRVGGTTGTVRVWQLWCSDGIWMNTSYNH